MIREKMIRKCTQRLTSARYKITFIYVYKGKNCQRYVTLSFLRLLLWNVVLRPLADTIIIQWNSVSID